MLHVVSEALLWALCNTTLMHCLLALVCVNRSMALGL